MLPILLEEREEMNAIGIYKKCMRCGSKEHNLLERSKCRCGGYLYVIGTIYQERVIKVQKGENHGC